MKDVRVHSSHAHVFIIAGLGSMSEDLDRLVTPFVCRRINRGCVRYACADWLVSLMLVNCPQGAHRPTYQHNSQPRCLLIPSLFPTSNLLSPVVLYTLSGNSSDQCNKLYLSEEVTNRLLRAFVFQD